MEYFEGRLDDLAAEAGKGSFAATGFMTPQESAAASDYLKKQDISYVLSGGYDTAERKIALFVPEWCLSLDEDSRRAAIEEEIAERVTSLMLKREDYLSSHPEDVIRPIGHRDYLGALLALGIDRSRVGDICVSDLGAAVFVANQTGRFLLSDERPLTGVGREKITVLPFEVPEGFDGWRRYKTISGVGASERIDSVLSALTDLSREKIKEALLRGEAEKNYLTAAKPDEKVSVGDIISLRGWGKAKITGFGGTKKDRVRVTADKYI